MYAPPEMLAGKQFTVQGDIYALGCCCTRWSSRT
jgi:hypothetical protein